MRKPDYTFDSAVRTGHGSGLRIAVLGLLVAGITAGGVWFFMPGIRENTDNAGEAAEAVRLPSVAEVIAGNSAGADPDAAVKAGALDLPYADEVSGVSGQDEEPDMASVTEAAALPGTDPEAYFAPEPVKGKAHMSDREDSGPVFAANAMPDDVFAGELAAAQTGKDLKAVRERLCGLLPKTEEYSAQWRKAAEHLGRVNTELFFKSGHEDWQTHVVSRGESLYSIAGKYNLTVDALRKMNRIDAGNNVLWTGDRLIVGRAEWSIKISKSARLLMLYDSGRFFAVYDIGIGRNGSTPAGNFVISAKIEAPEYRTPDGRIIAPGAPDNEFGSRFLKLSAADGGGDGGYGIHGTADESSVTGSLSHGCIRMRNKEVEELFTIVPKGVRVQIVE